MAGVYAPSVAADHADPRQDKPGLPGSPLDGAFRDARRLRLRPGAVLFNEGDASDRVVLLVSARVKASTFSEEGQETVLGFRSAGDVLGDLSAIDGEEHSARVTVVEEGEALVVSAARFVAALEEQPKLAVNLLRLVIARLRDADHKRAEFATLDVAGRVAQRLVELAGTYGEPAPDGIRIDLVLSQRELAGWVGSSREAVNKALAQLEGAGLVGKDGRHLVVRDLDGLRRRGG